MNRELEELINAAIHFKASYTADTAGYRAAKERLWNAIDALQSESPSPPPPDDEFVPPGDLNLWPSS